MKKLVCFDIEYRENLVLRYFQVGIHFYHIVNNVYRSCLSRLRSVVLMQMCDLIIEILSVITSFQQ